MLPKVLLLCRPGPLYCSHKSDLTKQHHHPGIEDDGDGDGGKGVRMCVRERGGLRENKSIIIFWFKKKKKV